MCIVNINDKVIANSNSGVELRDASIVGLTIRIGTRKKVWSIHTRQQGRLVRITLGQWPVVSVEDARLRACEWLYANSRQHNRPQRPITTTTAQQDVSPPPSTAHIDVKLKDLLEDYAREKHIKAASIKSYQQSLDVEEAQALVTSNITTIDGNKAKQLYQALVKRYSPATANKHLSIYATLHRWWSEEQGLPLPTCWDRVKKLKDGVRERVLSENQIARLGVLVKDSKKRAFIAVALCTGLRISEIGAAEIDTDALTLSCQTTKNGKPHTIPITQQVADLWLSVGKWPAKIGHWASEISKETGIRFAAHDLRRTFATHASRLGVDLSHIKALLNHSSSSDVTLNHYLHLTTDDLRSDVELVSSRMLELLCSTMNNR